MSPPNRTKVGSHTKCNGVFPSSSWASHAAGYAQARNLSNNGEAFEQAATWRGVQPRSSLDAGKSGHSLMMLPTISNGGLCLTMACRSVVPLKSGSEIEGMELAMARKQSGLDRAMSFRIMFQSSDSISPSRKATGSSTILELAVFIVLLLLPVMPKLLLLFFVWVGRDAKIITITLEALIDRGRP